MNEAHIDLNADDSSRGVAEPLPDDDRLLTTRLPPMTPPPMRPPSVPPLSAAPSFAPSGTYRADAGQPRASWWRALLTATFPPQSMAPAAIVSDERIFRRRIGATCAGMALGFVILALALGLRGAEPLYTPVVSAALIVSRSVVALGFLAFGHSLLRMAERFFAGPSAPPGG
jgi:hypothetical protein